MKNFSAFLLPLIALLMFASCDGRGIRGNRHVTVEQRPTGAFTSVSASGEFEIAWKVGPPSVSITTDSNLQEHIEVRQEGNELHLRWRGSLHPSHGVKAAISSASLQSSELTGACRLTAHQLVGETFAIETAGAARVNLDGNVHHLLVDMTGASNMHAENLKTAEADMSLTGASRADVTVSDALHVTIAGAGKVTYDGEPKVIEKSISGAGRVSRRD